MAPKPYSATAPIKALKGSETNPSVTFSGDEDTGLYSSGNNEICVSADGSQKAKFNPDGLEINGDLNLDSGGLYSTTLQLVTPTANRSISFPDQTGVVGLVGGPTGSIQFNQAGALRGTSDFSTTLNWNNAAATFTGLKLNVTDTASAADSKLLELQINGNTKLSLGGNELILDTDRNHPQGREGLFFSSIFNQRVGIGTRYASASAGLSFWALDKCDAAIANWGFFVNGNKGISFTSGQANLTNPDTTLLREGVGILAQRFGTGADPQAFRVYNTYTDASNYERGFFQWNTNVLEIGTEAGGTGSNRSLTITSATSSIGINGPDNTSVNLYNPSQTYIRIRRGSTEDFEIDGSNVTVRSGSGYAWSSTTQAGAGIDTALARDSAGVVKITDGSTGTGYLKLIPTTVSALTAAATVGAGTKAFVTDSTSTLSSHHGQTVVGGGSNFVPVFSDGTNWIVG